MSYVAEKLKCAIEDLHRHGRRCYDVRNELHGDAVMAQKHRAVLGTEPSHLTKSKIVPDCSLRRTAELI